ncbi:mitochondrial import inner membrane translocase subunit Tim10 B [Solea solea]|uniref:mitochondrial import inner membrane translocase subunit Tim10 B n=1 Tax=Solea solea TaxID=90069 RepID=UPI002729CFB9|nr:mitochondrial import inner membrane translocase subunit Tim10 B [Solea solea]XP_058483581.1 mitochondrial import inner membrane translocase subunit Tim10 B [Solea solea]
MEPDQQLRNLRDFLMVYNRMTEICFQRCTNNFNYRNLTMDEERCVDSCAGKLIRSNHRLMATYVQLMPRMVQRRMEEMESKAAEMAKATEAAEAAASASNPPAAVSQSLIVSPELPQIPALLQPSLTDGGAEAHGSVLRSAGLDLPAELDAAAAKSTIVTEVKLSAATPLTPLTPLSQTVNPTLLNNQVDNGPSYTAGFSQLSTSVAQSGSSVPEFIPSLPTSLSQDVPVAVISAPAQPNQERAPEAPPVSSQ